jgi:hypothetical protein
MVASQFPGVELVVATRSLKLFATEVMPNFAKYYEKGGKRHEVPCHPESRGIP